MRFDLITIFPEFFHGPLDWGIVRRAHEANLIEVGIHDLRNFTHDRHRTVDDRPFGGGEGMVLKPEPLAEALGSLGIRPKAERNFTPIWKGREFADGGETRNSEVLVTGSNFSRAADSEEAAGLSAPEPSVAGERAAVILLAAQGRPFTQSVARDLARLDRIVLLCGRYEGVDERINQLYCDMELSIGDYVLSGGEL